MRAPRGIEDVLARARVFEGEYTSDELEASRRRITQELGEFRWLRLVAGPGGGQARAGCGPTALHERAARDLRTLSQSIIHDDDAAQRIARFDTVRDPGGALAFACLLVLADREEGAQFWWQFAAGAGNATSALCLYLLHLRRGELRDAQYWARQLAELEREPCQYMPVPHEVVAGTQVPMAVTVHYELPRARHAVRETAVKGAVEDLDIGQLDDFGPIPQPGPDLAGQWADLVSS
ncbi:hypothetical protein ACFYZ9_04365 [Streptomyces sp. NPDC001691]|uniref:hypothetical protein n=1 Tax=unclassified Streptomyces TaxID=2593676 RepID=UPI000DEB2130|nr:hypothetical protein [Streptomyces sp. SDr-06]RCH65603.1 hypothetical protein DT019_26135 [Streptomyces sp. SDr-06]